MISRSSSGSWAVPPVRSGARRALPFGRPAVTEQAPFDENGHPFPTQFYVTCRHLAAAISRLEAAAASSGGREPSGGSRAGAKLEEANASSARSVRARRRHRRLYTWREPQVPARARGLRAGASGYELGDRILAELPALWPDTCCSGM